MQDHKTDRRVLYTKMFLRESLLSLMKKKPIDRITPTELCRHAGIHRNTFYTYYSGTRSLLKSIEDELYEEVGRAVKQSLDGKAQRSVVAEINLSIYKNKDLCGVLFSDYGDKDFLKRIFDLIHDWVIEEWKKIGLENEEQLEALYAFYSGGSRALIQEWALTGLKPDAEALAAMISKLCHRGLGGLLQPEQSK
ncbi:hypothetical protein SDC9_40411 [bioreactor metagenome]|uniref:HTH tetR-type domain-containing protein n=1 Tax=bioreactor metagenome TaxID=1076179 RepID=A0A644VS87_9ZZZZ